MTDYDNIPKLESTKVAAAHLARTHGCRAGWMCEAELVRPNSPIAESSRPMAQYGDTGMCLLICLKCQ